MSDEDVAMLQRLAHYVAAEHRGYCHGRADRQDLVSVAMLAGVKASKTWDPNGGRTLGAWMFAKMRRDVYHYLRDGGLGSRTIRTQTNGRETTSRVTVDPTDFKSQSQEDEPRGVFEPTVSYDLATYLDRREWRRQLPKRDRRMVELYEQGRTQAEIALELGLSQPYVGKEQRRIATLYRDRMAA